MSNIQFYLNSFNSISMNEYKINLVYSKNNQDSCKTIEPFSSNNYDKIANIEKEKLLTNSENVEKCNTISSINYMDIYRNECYYKRLS